MRRRNQGARRLGPARATAAVLLGVLMLASACSSGSTPTAAPPKTGSGAQEEALPTVDATTLAKTGTFILENLTMGVIQGAGTLLFNWVDSLIAPDQTPQEIEEIQKGVEQLQQNVQQLTGEVTAMRSTMDQDFKDQQGVILDQGLAPDRAVIDDATLKLQTFTADTTRAIEAGTPLPKINDYIGTYGDPRNLSELYNLLDHDLHTALTAGGSNTGGGSLIGSADAIFAGLESQAEAAKTAAPFDDRPLWQRLGLPATATPADITAACQDLRASQPTSAVCASPATGNAPTVSYYDRMQTFIDYYVNYQVNGLLVVTAALYAWDDGGRCPVPAAGDCAIAAERAQEITAKVVGNVRQQLGMAGAPVSTDERVLEIGTGDAASLWSTSTTSATFTQTPPSTPPNGWTEWRVPIDCTRTGAVRETDRLDQGTPCEVRDNPYVVAVPSSAPEAQICVGSPAIGTNVAARIGKGNGVYDALASEWQACTRPDGGAATGLRVPTHAEMQSALAKQPEAWMRTLGDPAAETQFGAGTLLSYTPAQVVCGNAVADDLVSHWYSGSYDMTEVNVDYDRWINGRAETWSRSTSWLPTPQHAWDEPLVLAFDSSGHQPAPEAGYPADGPCERVYGDMGQDGWADHLLPRGFTQCVSNPSLYRDWCYGHRNYHGKDLPAAGGSLRVWGVHSLVACPSQAVDPATGQRPAAWQATGCEPDARPTGKDWEIPGCKTPAGRWTLCGTAWVDALLPAAPEPSAPTTSTTSTSTTTAAPTPSTEPDASTSTTSAPITTPASTMPTTTAAPASTTTSAARTNRNP